MHIRGQISAYAARRVIGKGHQLTNDMHVPNQRVLAIVLTSVWTSAKSVVVGVFDVRRSVCLSVCLSAKKLVSSEC